MTLFKNFMQISAYLFLSFTLNIIHWVPSLLVETVVNVSIIVLYILSVFFVYKMIRTIYENQVKKSLYKVSMYAAILLSYIGMFAIIMIGTGYNKSTYIETYKFKDKVFYVYQNSDLSYEVSLKDDILPIRSVPIASFKDDEIRLKKEKDYIYAVLKKIHKKIYNMKINKKEKNE
ncbi:hypothetical protein JHD47_05870 [Sulfurimonas sp. SAG-AH-194-L11]|nr:hypothetical protein [Sulfurimonas sp. SAG-AH-194-L11]MDF1877339.1 hypothetical protein [Sulfurimonas sp. SAG-AH-194-L11]